MLSKAEVLLSKINEILIESDLTALDIYGHDTRIINLTQELLKVKSLESIARGNKKEKLLAVATIALIQKGYYTAPVLLSACTSLQRYKRMGVAKAIQYDVAHSLIFGAIQYRRDLKSSKIDIKW